MQEIILFLLCFVFIYMLYYMVTIRKQLNVLNQKKKNERRVEEGKPVKISKKENKLPAEILYIVYKYQLDLSKFSIVALLHVVGLVSSFDIALVVTVASMIKGTGLQLLAGFAMMLPLIVVSYHLIGKYYQKKGMKKDVSVSKD